MSDDTGPIPVQPQTGNGEAAWSHAARTASQASGPAGAGPPLPPMPPLPPLPPLPWDAGTAEGDAGFADGVDPEPTEDQGEDEASPLPPELEAALVSSSELVRQPGRARRRSRARRLTVFLGAALLLLAGFLGGIVAQKNLGSGAASAAPSGFAGPGGGFPGGGQGVPGGATGQGQGQNQGQNQGQGQNPGGNGGVTAGTVKMVDGNTVYVTSASGGTVKIVTSDSSKVVKMSAGTAADITPGDSIVVQGSTGGDGSVTASSVTVSPPGVTPFGGGAARTGGASPPTPPTG